MNAKECLETRRSIRKYKSDVIPVDVLYEIIEYLHFLGSGCQEFRARNPEFLSISLLKTVYLCLLKI